MTNFILNIYSTLFEILLWVIVIGFTIGGVMFGAMGTDADGAGLGLLAVVLGGIVGFVAGIVFCLLIVPLVLLSNIRDHLVSSQPTNIGDHLKSVQNDTSLILRQATEINGNLKGYVDSTRHPEVTGDDSYRTTVEAGTENEDTHRSSSSSGKVRTTARHVHLLPRLK